MIAVWFSCGAASAVALKRTVDTFGAERVRAVNNPVAEEHPDNRRFLKDVSDWCGIEIETVTNCKYPNASAVEVWSHRKAMAFRHGAPCTDILKKNARQQWEKTNPVQWHVLGFTSDEYKRHKRFTMTERSNVIPILIIEGITKNRCYEILQSAGLQLPAPYLMGYPNANCIGCVKATSPTYWNLVRRTDPVTFWKRALQSRTLGVRLVRHQGRRIFLDELPEDAIGRPLKSMPDCGTFCEER